MKFENLLVNSIRSHSRMPKIQRNTHLLSCTHYISLDHKINHREKEKKEVQRNNHHCVIYRVSEIESV